MSNDFKRKVRPSSNGAVFSGAVDYKELEQRFRARSGFEACPDDDFERPGALPSNDCESNVKKKSAAAVFSSVAEENKIARAVISTAERMTSRDARAVFSSAQWLSSASSDLKAMCRKASPERRFQVLSMKREPAPAVISSVKWLRSTPEQCFRAPSGCRARPSSDFERKVRKSSTSAKKQRQCGFLKCCPRKGSSSSIDFEP